MYHLKEWLHRSPVALITTLLGLFSLASPLEVSAQQRTDSVRVFFRAGQSQFDPSFRNNGASIDAFVKMLRESQADPEVEVEVQQVSLQSSSSPEGALEVNQRLSRERQQSIMDYLGARLKMAQPEADRSRQTFDWDLLRRLVQEDASMPEAYRENVLAKLDSEDPLSVNELPGTSTWQYLMEHIFPQMRTTLVVFVWEAWKELQLPELCYEEPAAYPFVYPEFDALDDHYSVSQAIGRPSTRDLVVKLNLLTLPALVLNGGIEIQPFAHFSLNIPVYYCGVNWFSQTVKFRTLAFQPEVRYWFRQDLHGLFLGAHANLAWYNVALGGDYRYQDHAGRFPSLGGGIGVGYKTTLGRNNDSRWGLEFGLGGGVLPLRYDVFYNVENGRLAAEDCKKTYWGIDQAFISLTYRIGQLKLKQK